MRIVLFAVLATLLVAPATALADHPQPARDIAHLDYSPVGEFGPGETVPTHDSCEETILPLKAGQGKRFNPSGKYNAFDNNVFEVLCLPFRGAGDESNADPYGNSPDPTDPEKPQNPAHGYCSPNPEPRPGEGAPLSAVAGECPNHQLEYIEYYEETMQDILGDFGVTLHRYEFHNPGGGNTLAGRAINPAAVVPGVDHPEDTVIIGAHFDQTTEGPASAWDSAEGHAQVIRVAKLMADYWKATGTRPSATVKFIPWDAEESGTFGSQDYAENNIVPGEEEKVRGYWNTDPCAGGYPAYRNGNPTDRVALGIQIARPQEVPDEYDVARVEQFNAHAPQVVEEVFEKLDDTVPTTGGAREVFISQAEAAASGGTKMADQRPGGPVTIGGARPVAFSSDWVNFLNRGVPFFNPGPEVTGPSDESEPGNPDGIAILHTPNDNIVTLNKYTGDATGAMFSEGWIKGMEMCSHLLAWGMLRGDQGGAQTVSTEQNGLVAYYEALPNEAETRKAVNFDASGTYLYTDPATRTKADASQFTYEWDFGDGSTGTGQEVGHFYAEPGVYQSKLTVTDPVTGKSDTMSIPITVVSPVLEPPVLGDLADVDPDGNYELRWSYDETVHPSFRRYEVEEAPDYRNAFTDPAEDLPARWESSVPTEPTIQPWQHSDDATENNRGNLRHSGERSFWSGINQADQRPGPAGPNYGVSKLTLKESFQLAEDGELVYRSLYANDLNDRGRVEVAVDDGSLDWVTVDRVATETYYTEGISPVLDATDFQERRVDLSRFANQKVRLRFVYALGGSQYVDVIRTGWYVDDIKVDTGTFKRIGDPESKTFQVSDRTQSTLTYRVRAVHLDAISRNSAPETIQVTAPPRDGGPTPPTQPPGEVPENTQCRVVNGFRSVRVRPRGGGLRFSFRRRSKAPVRVEVIRQSRGRRISGDRRIAFFGRRTKAFTWGGRNRKVTPGAYYVRMSIPVQGGRDVRRVALLRTNGKFRLRRSFYRRPSCGLLTRFGLQRSVFGGLQRKRRAIRIAFRLSRQARVRVVVLRGRKVVRRFRAADRAPNRTHRLRLRPKGLRPGEYRIRLTAVSGTTRVVSTLGARRL